MTTTIYAVPGADGAPAQIQPGRGFVTHRLVVQSGAEAAFTLTPIGDEAEVRVEHAPDWAEHYDAAAKARFLIRSAALADPPTGKALAAWALAFSGTALVVTPSWIDAPVPAVVSRRQARLELLSRPPAVGDAATLLDDVEARIAATTDRALQIYWADSLEFHRDHAELLAVADLAQLDASAVDDLFRAAAARA